VRRQKILVALFLIVAGSLSLAGCASLSTAAAARQCGDPCASMSCPSAFSCQVDAHCTARCQAEVFKPGTP
jgi:hypothetical protein